MVAVGLLAGAVSAVVVVAAMVAVAVVVVVVAAAANSLALPTFWGGLHCWSCDVGHLEE